jgi:hypothetical protein
MKKTGTLSGCLIAWARIEFDARRVQHNNNFNLACKLKRGIGPEEPPR